MSGSNWSIPIADVVAKLKGDADKVVRLATFHLFQSVVNLSPVDTGRFRANWNVSEAEPVFDTTDSEDEMRGDQEAHKALSMQVGGIAYMCNGLPYAQRLEYGWSKQAPTGMVRLSAADFRSFLRDAIAEKK